MTITSRGIRRSQKAHALWAWVNFSDLTSMSSEEFAVKDSDGGWDEACVKANQDLDRLISEKYLDERADHSHEKTV